MNAVYGLLDDPKRWSTFSSSLERADPHQHWWQSQVVIEGMTCGACALNVESALRAVPGVKSAHVNGATHRANVVWSQDEVTPSLWFDAVASAGYHAVPAQDHQTRLNNTLQARQNLWRWAVAGFCMMQVMMYALPPYFSAEHEITADMLGLLRWAAWVLTLPVMFFSADVFTKAAWRDIRQGHISMDLPVALGLWVSFIVSTIAMFEPTGMLGDAVYFDSITMFVFFLLTGRWLESRLREKTAGSLEALINRLPDTVRRLNAQQTLDTVATEEVRVGDVLEVRPGEVFSADATLIEGATLVEEALLTGESTPLPRSMGEVVMAGSHNLSQTVRVQVSQVGASTRFAQIVDLMQSASLHKPRLAILADRIAKPFLIAVLFAAVISAWLAWDVSPSHALMVAVSVLIVTCPCALTLATPAAMLSAAGALARQGILLRDVQTLETLAQVDTVVFDKTGTLTSDRFELQSLYTAEGVMGADDMTSPLSQQLLALAAGMAQHSWHPYSRAVVALASDILPATGMGDVQETVGQGLSAQYLDPKQHPAVQSLRLGSLPFCQGQRGQWDVPALAAQHGQVHLCDSHRWLASFAFREVLRPDALETVQALKAQGMEVFLMSGDKVPAVKAMAQRLELMDGNFIAQCSPQEKLQRVKALQSLGRRVAMVGDGFNDMPVLAGAHVSVAFGEAVPLARAKADVVVQGQHLRAVAQILALAKRTRRVVTHSLIWAGVYNAVCVPLAFMGYLPPWLAGLGMALSSVVVVAYALQLAQPLRWPTQGVKA
jgi:Cu2+-exporting ATPase